MKVLLINGSRRSKGCTFTALSEIEKELNKRDIETEIYNAGAKVFKGEVDLAVQEATEIIKGSYVPRQIVLVSGRLSQI